METEYDFSQRIDIVNTFYHTRKHECILRAQWHYLCMG